MGSNPTPRTIDERYTLYIFQVLRQPKKDDYPENTIAPFRRRLRDLTIHIDLNDLDEHAIIADPFEAFVLFCLCLDMA